MGVPGLLTFVCSYGSSLLEPYKLRDTTLIIDGNNFCGYFYSGSERFKENKIFGGDYDEFHSCVKEFFERLLKCGVNPIVLFDGCPPETKFKKVEERRYTKLKSLINLSKLGPNRELFPVLLFNAFLDALAEVKIKYLQLYEEADQKIASIAKHLNCPVLSNDSDFFIYDVDVIPLREFDFKFRKDGDCNFYFYCRLYRSGNLSREFKGLEKSILPLVSVIMGNDYLDKTFANLFTQSGPMDYHSVLHRLRTSGSPESILTEILQSVDKSEAESLEPAIRALVKGYDTEATRDTIPVIYGLDLSGLPDKFRKLYESCKLSANTLGLLRYSRYNLGITFEDISEYSCHYLSISIIGEIYRVLRTLMKAPEKVTLNMRFRSSFRDVPIICPDQDYTSVRLRGNVFGENEDFRRGVFFQSLCLEEEDWKPLGIFDKDWILFLTSVIYWTRNTRKAGESHLSAVLLMALCNYTKSMKDRTGGGRAGGSSEVSFSQLLERVPRSEYKKLIDRLDQVVSSVRNVLTRNYFFPATHVFASLQSVVFHVLQLNSVLGEPLGELQIFRFYSGTLLFKLFFALSEKRGFAELVLEGLVEMQKAYAALKSAVPALPR